MSRLSALGAGGGAVLRGGLGHLLRRAAPQDGQLVQRIRVLHELEVGGHGRLAVADQVGQGVHKAGDAVAALIHGRQPDVPGLGVRVQAVPAQDEGVGLIVQFDCRQATRM